MNETKKRLVRGAMWLGITRVFINLIGLVSTVLLSRLLHPADFGLVAITSALAMILAVLTELSLAEALVHHEAPDDDHYNTAFTLNALRTAILALILAAMAWPIAVIFGDSRLFAIMLAMAFGQLVSGVMNPRLALFERNLEFRQWIVLGMLEKVLGFIVAVAIAFAYHSYWALVLGQIASQAARACASFVLIPYKPRFTLCRWRELMSFSVWLTLGQAVQAINWRSDPLILGKFLPLPTLGQFNMGGRIASLAIGDVLQPVAQVLFPALAMLRSEPERFRAAYLRSQGLLCLIALPLAFGVAAVAQPLQALFLGPAWTSAVTVIQFTALTAVAPRLVSTTAVALATGNTRAMFARDVRALATRMPILLAGLYFAPALGWTRLTGAMAGLLVAALVNAGMNMHLVSGVTRITLRDQLSILWRPLLAAAIMGTLVTQYVSRAPVDAPLTTHAATMAVAVAIGIVSYAVVLAGLWGLSQRPDSAEVEALDLLDGLLNRFRRIRPSN